jgi:hypothetical protein
VLNLDNKFQKIQVYNTREVAAPSDEVINNDEDTILANFLNDLAPSKVAQITGKPWLAGL